MSRRTRLILVEPFTVEAATPMPGDSEAYRLTTAGGSHWTLVGYTPSFPGDRVDPRTMREYASLVLVDYIAGKVRRGEPA